MLVEFDKKTFVTYIAVEDLKRNLVVDGTPVKTEFKAEKSEIKING